MSYRKPNTRRHSSNRRKRYTSKRIKKRQSGGADKFKLGDLTFYFTPRKEIQLFTEEEEKGILKDTLDFFNRSPDVLLQLSVPGNVRRYITNNKNALTADVFKYQINQNGTVNKNEVLTKREITLYVFPLLVQMSQILYENALTETDPTNKNLVRGYHHFILGLLRNVSNIINPLWFDRIYSTLSFIDIDSIPGVSTLKNQAKKLGNVVGKLLAEKGAQQDVEYETRWYRGYPDDKYMDVNDMDHVYYYPVANSRYTNMDDYPRIDRILNQMAMHGDMPQMPVFKQNAKHTLKRKTKVPPLKQFQRGVKKLTNVQKLIGTNTAATNASAPSAPSAPSATGAPGATGATP